MTALVRHDPHQLGQLLADSGYFSDARGAAQAAVKVMAGAELGFPPIQSMMGVYIVKGKVTLSANLMAAAIKRHPRYTFRVTQHTVDECSIDFIEDGEVIGTSTFTLDDAKAAGLASGDTWRKFPKNMLYARALSNGAKWYCPDVFGGPIYTPDELGAQVDGETGELVGGQPEPKALAAVSAVSDIDSDPDKFFNPPPQAVKLKDGREGAIVGLPDERGEIAVTPYGDPTIRVKPDDIESIDGVGPEPEDPDRVDEQTVLLIAAELKRTGVKASELRDMVRAAGAGDLADAPLRSREDVLGMLGGLSEAGAAGLMTAIIDRNRAAE